jgi:K+/H+ antiporter YhaU regulatory subunit KhtT
MMHVTGQTLRFEEVFIEDGHSLANQTLEQAHIGRKTGLLVVAIRSPDGSIRYNPGGKTLLSHGDVLIILGTRAQVAELYNLLNQSSLDTSLADVLYNIEEH